MSDPNILVSNGTCYTAAGKELDKTFIPCGNDAFGHQTCCGVGDNCLADNACFGVYGTGYGSELTYFGGCTDPDYKDASCPDKKGIDQPWIALTLCDNGDGVWGACSQEGNPSTLQAGSYCSCTDTASFSPTAFSDARVLASFASLPTATGGSIQFAAGHVPTAPPAEATTGAQSNTGAGSSGGASASATGSIASSARSTGGNSGASRSGTGSTASSPNSTGSASGSASAANTSSSKSTSGKTIGIGVGVAVGVLFLLAVIGAFFLIRRRRRRRAAASAANIEKEGARDAPPTDILGRTSGVTDATVSEADGRPVSKADKPGTSELFSSSVLEADGKGVSKANKPGTFELDSDNVVEADGRTAQPWSMRSELDSRPVVPANLEYPTAVRDGHLSPVAELPGTRVLKRHYAPGTRTRD
ncbi:hypothetical protein BDV96DRAFT_568275 [Lophiotrema nucula]|uniref:Uncharacterized protein n=1 Tax=Lophiotrema nucula TaxID=690887 RepID=A0A6A5ZJN5_9PLEO|nr:hypothetical protein BDV96DRAFT_568275 [Lophiotrema nucula]